MTEFLLLCLLQVHRTAHFNATAQVTVGCQVDTEQSRVVCSHMEVEPRVVRTGDYLWIHF